MWSKLRTVGLVTLVTILIWVWADAETQGGRGGSDLLSGGAGVAAPRAAEEEFVVERLPVYVAQSAEPSPSAPAVRLRAEQSVLTGVRIVGPAGTIERVKKGEVSLYAVAAVSDADYTPKQGPMTYGYAVRAQVQVCPSGLGLRIASPSDAATLRVFVDKPE